MVLLAVFATEDQAEKAKITLARMLSQIAGSAKAESEYLATKHLKKYYSEYRKEMEDIYNKIFGLKQTGPEELRESMFKLDWEPTEAGIGTDGCGVLKFNVYSAGYGIEGISNFLKSLGAIRVDSDDTISTDSVEDIMQHTVEYALGFEKMSKLPMKKEAAVAKKKPGRK
jgi:hypothetical protein